MAIIEKITGLVFAGGVGVRVGYRDKATLPLKGVPLLKRILHRLKPQVGGGVMISIHDTPGPTTPPCEGCSFVLDGRNPRQGPLAGLESGLKVLATDWLLSVPVDLPFLPIDLAQRLFSEANNRGCVAIARNRERVHPVVGLWPRTILLEITRALDNNDCGLKYFLRHTPHVEVPFPDEIGGVDPFFNINTPQELEWADRWLGNLPNEIRHSPLDGDCPS